MRDFASLFLRLAIRNVFRNRVRTAIALLAIAAGCAALMVNGGVIYNIFAELREDAIRGPIAPALESLARGTIPVEAMIEGRYPVSDGVTALRHAGKPGVLKTLIEF